jgi:hypothetical protein
LSVNPPSIKKLSIQGTELSWQFELSGDKVEEQRLKLERTTGLQFSKFWWTISPPPSGGTSQLWTALCGAR